MAPPASSQDTVGRLLLRMKGSMAGVSNITRFQMLAMVSGWGHSTVPAPPWPGLGAKPSVWVVPVSYRGSGCVWVPVAFYIKALTFEFHLNVEVSGNIPTWIVFLLFKTVRNCSWCTNCPQQGPRAGSADPVSMVSALLPSRFVLSLTPKCDFAPVP